VRIVYVTTLERGGPLTHLRALAPAVARRGFDVHVVWASESVAAGVRAAGVPSTVAALQHKWDLAGAARMWPTLRGADVVHTRDRRAGLYGRIMGAMAGAKVVHTLHGLPERMAVEVGRTRKTAAAPDAARPLRDRLHILAERQLGALGMVVTPSRAMAAWLAGAGVPPSRVEVIGHWIDLRRDRPAARRGPLVAGVVARLEWWKGIDVLIEACAQATQPLRLEIFGDGTERARLQQLAARHGVAARFHGEVHDVRERLDALDVLVSPSRAENAPFALLEGMAHGLPVIGTRVGGVPDIVEHERTGLLVEPGLSRPLADALDLLAADAALATSFGMAGALRASREFCEARVLPRFVALYHRLAEKPRAGAEAAH
jgi:glycosyltransferase involved in cell wall biosynthesis